MRISSRKAPESLGFRHRSNVPAVGRREYQFRWYGNRMAGLKPSQGNVNGFIDLGPDGLRNPSCKRMKQR